jgi:hypothetical protein
MTSVWEIILLTEVQTIIIKINEFNYIKCSNYKEML